jgi:hypothetical protein
VRQGGNRFLHHVRKEDVLRRHGSRFEMALVRRRLSTLLSRGMGDDSPLSGIAPSGARRFSGVRGQPKFRKSIPGALTAAGETTSASCSRTPRGKVSRIPRIGVAAPAHASCLGVRQMIPG